jgi:hypothetical protein
MAYNSYMFDEGDRQPSRFEPTVRLATKKDF